MPDWKREVEAAIESLGLSAGRDQAIAEELAAHLEEQYESLLRDGMDEQTAYRTVTKDLTRTKLQSEFGGLLEPLRTPLAPGSEPRGGVLAGFGRDLRMGLRMLRANPGLAAVAILSLSLGIGANAAIFQLIDAVLLRTLPVPDPQNLARISMLHEGRVGSSVSMQQDFSSAIWEQLRNRQRVFSSIAAWSTESFELGHGGISHTVDGMWVSGSFFATLELQPALGRLFTSADDVKGCGIQGAVISYAFWQARYSGEASAIGSTISLDRRPFTIIGVTPPAFTGLVVGNKFDVALPLCSEPAVHANGSYTGGWSDGPTVWWLAAIGRLRPGSDFAHASAQLESISSATFAATIPPTYDAIQRQAYLRFSFRAAPAATGVSEMRNEYERPLYLLLAISGLVLLIACANLASLLLARASARKHEMALRLAMGASRGRLVRQLLSESLLLAAFGAALGGLLAYALSRGLIAGISSSDNPVYLPLHLDWRVAGFIAAAGVLACIVFGVLPALQGANAEPGTLMKSGSRGMTVGRDRLLLRRGFVIMQMAFSLVLVVVALLFVRTFTILANVSPGFDQNHILVAGLDFSGLNLPPEKHLAYKLRLMERLRAIPGVTSAADTAIVPLSGNGWNEFIDLPDIGVQRKLVDFNAVTPGYFKTMAIPMLAGRDFSATDTPNSPGVAIVNQAFARTLLRDPRSLQGTIAIRQDAGKPDKLYRIVGVVGNTKYYGLREQVGPLAYLDDNQNADQDEGMSVMIHSDEGLQSLMAAVKDAVAKESPEIDIDFTVLRTSIRETLGREQLMATLSGFYGALAAILAIIGLYGIMAYAVARRKGEIGIRMALGATRSRILTMVVREALLLLGIGLAFGVVLVILAGRAVQSLLFGLKATDPATMACATAGMAIVALAASLIPARRAATVQPVEILREE
jgi:putative ABC transport system permease protein